MKKFSLNRQLLESAAGFSRNRFPAAEGTVGWSCPSNIALIKYWGKRTGQLPMNPSLSMTLQEARTFTRIRFRYDPGKEGPGLIFRFGSLPAPAFERRIRSYLESLLPMLPWLGHTSLEIDSENTFPHSSGIASSASAMGALALCLTDMEQQITGTAGGTDPLQKASFLARLGSGSACRSIYPEFSLWGSAEGWDGSSDEFAIPVTAYHASFRTLKDAILIVESGQKQVSSSAGHALMEGNPFAEARFTQAGRNLDLLGRALREGDWDTFIALAEEEALTLHAMMLTGKPGYLLMQPGTLSIIRKIRAYRESTSARIAFTLDAGANVHLIYDGLDEEQTGQFIRNELIPHCEAGAMIADRLGKGPLRL